MFFTVPWGVNFSTRGDSWAQRLRLRLRLRSRLRSRLRLRLRLRKNRKKDRRARDAFFILSP
jgi:hypothetical protein